MSICLSNINTIFGCKALKYRSKSNQEKESLFIENSLRWFVESAGVKHRLLRQCLCWKLLVCWAERERGRKLPHAAVKHWLMRPVTCCGQYFSIHLKSQSKQFPIYMFPARCTVQCVRSDKDEGAVFQPLPPSPGVWTGSCTDLKILDGKKKEDAARKKEVGVQYMYTRGKKTSVGSDHAAIDLKLGENFRWLRLD